MRVATTVLLACIAVSFARAGPNLFQNPSFERSAPGEDEFGWSIKRGAGEAVMDIAVDRQISHDGKSSLRISQRAAVYSAFSQSFVPEPCGIYAAQVWVRGEDIVSAGGGARLFIGNEKGNTVMAARFKDSWCGRDWRQLQCVFNAGTRPRMSIVFMLHNATGTVWFAEPSLRRVTPEEAAAISGRAHGWSHVEPQAESGFAYFGRPVAHVCRDFPSVVWLSAKLNFSEPGKSRPRIVFELPPGIEVVGGYREWTRSCRATPHGTRCEMSGSTANYCPIYLTTDWQSGKRAEARLYVEWAGGGQATPHVVPIHCIDLPKARRPKRLVAGLSGAPLGIYPGDFTAYAARLGFNTVNLWTSAAWLDPPDPDFVKAVDAYRDAGFWVSANYSPLSYPHYRELLAAEEDAQAVGPDGTRIPSVPCPSYRGNAYRTEGERIANMAASGLSYAHLDEEVWRAEGICFCDRCLGLWTAYREERHPNLPDTSPLEFERKPGEHPQLHEAWARFKCGQVTDMFGGWRQMLLDKVRARGARSSPEPWLDSWLAVSTDLCDMNRFLHDPSDLPRGLDHMVPMIYAEASTVREGLAPLVKAAGRDHLLVGLTGGEPGVGRQIFPPGEMRAQVLEAAFAPTMGYVLWTYPRTDVAGLAELAQANDVLAQVEDMLLDGQPSDRLKIARGRAHLSAFERDDEIVCFVRDYGRPGRVRVEVTGGDSWRVADAGTGETVADVEGARRAIALDLAEANARVLVLTAIE